MTEPQDPRRPPTQTPGGQAMRDRPRLVSIVVPLYNESGNVPVLAWCLDEVLRSESQPYELILVDDGSTDDTFTVINSLAAENPNVCGVSLSRNFGHQYALAAGLLCAKGDVVVTMDGDMQHPPALVPTLIRRWREGANIVHTRRQDTQQLSLVKRVTSRLFYRAFRLLSGLPVEPGMADFRLLDRIVVDELNRMREGHLLLRALFVWMGYQSAVVPFVVDPRHSGQTKYTFRKMVHLAHAGLLSFSTIPLRLGLTLGVLTGLLSFAELGYVLIAWLRGRAIPGWTSTLVVMTVLFGVLFIILGIQGQYLLRVYEQVHSRPPFIIERIIRQGPPQETSATSASPDPGPEH